MAEHPADDRGQSIFLTALRHHAVLVLLAFVAVVGAGVGYIVLADKSYTSESVILLRPVPGTPLSSEVSTASANQQTIAMSTETELVSTPPVHLIVGESLGIDLPAAGDVLRVDVPSATQTLRIRYTSSTPQQAEERAQAYAEGYLAYRSALGEEQQRTRLDQLQKQADAARDGLRDVSGQEGDFADREAEVFAARLAQLSALISGEEIVSTQPGEVIVTAERPSMESGLSPALILLACGLLGLAAGVALAMAREWQQDRVRTSHAVTVAGLPLVASLTVTKDSGELTGDSDDALRQIRAGVVARCPIHHVIAVVPTAERQSVAGLTRSLARSISGAGYSVLFIDSTGATAKDEAGLSEVLRREATADQVWHQEGSLFTITAGREPELARELRGGAAFGRLVSGARATRDYVILSCDEAGSADSDSTLVNADSAVLLASDGVTRHSDVQLARERVEALGVRPIALLGVSSRRTRTTAGKA